MAASLKPILFKYANPITPYNTYTTLLRNQWTLIVIFKNYYLLM